MGQRIFSDDFLASAGEGFLARELASDVVCADVGTDRVSRLLKWSDLDEILSTSALQPPRLRLHRQGVAVPVDRYTELVESAGEKYAMVRPEALYRELRDGASLILDGVDRLHPPIREAADDLMHLVRERAQVNLYLLWGSAHGFDTHWDDHDAFIVQVAGTKSWTVHGPGRPHPMRTDVDHSHSCPDQVVWAGELQPGQILHVPRGWWHTVRGTGGASLHLTFGFTRATGIDWVRWLTERLYAEDLFRQDLPRFSSPAEREEHRVQLAQRVSELATAAGIDEFLLGRDERFPRRRRFNLPWPVEFTRPDPAATVEFVPVLTPTIARNGQSLTVKTAGKSYTFASVAAPVIEALARKPTTSVAELQEESGLSDDRFEAVLQALAQQHLILIHP